VIQEKIDYIAGIVRSLTPVDDPGPAPCAAAQHDLAELFTRRLNDLRGPGDTEPAVITVGRVDDAARRVVELCGAVPDGQIIWQGDRPLARRDYAVGITRAEALIASTGSIVIEQREATDAFSSLLVDRHLVVAGKDRLLPDLSTFYRRLSERRAAGEQMANLVCITGCSRTADLEKLLVIPAHGPRQVRVILGDQPIDWPELRRLAGSPSSPRR
jgi:hypothetical protein